MNSNSNSNGIQIVTNIEKIGFGSSSHKTLRGLTAAQKALVQAGAILAFDCGRHSGGNNGTGTTWRIVVENRGFFSSRVPDAATLAEIEAAAAIG